MKTDCIECGLDEVGRGALCGPVVAACVIWGENTDDFTDKIRDSKKMSPAERKKVAEFIKENAVAWTVSFVDSRRIDEINILRATWEAMHQCLDKLHLSVDHILVDGNRFTPYKDITHTCVIKGDDKYISIAAASILAKVARDDFMSQLVEKNKEYEKYGWKRNQGYGTKEHIEALKQYGPTDQHRKTFKVRQVNSH